MSYVQARPIRESRRPARPRAGRGRQGRRRPGPSGRPAARCRTRAGPCPDRGPAREARRRCSDAPWRTCSARSSSASSSRPDTTPDEITGGNAVKMGEQVFMPGVVFTNVLLADEINRTPPRNQAALLEAMQERTVTVEGKTHQLPDPFLVIATQNPFEHEGIFPLPESQLDRFLFKIILDYADSRERDRDAAASAHRRDARHARRDPVAARRCRARPGPRRPRSHDRADRRRRLHRRDRAAHA